jgi:hypothetical protein
MPDGAIISHIVDVQGEKAQISQTRDSVLDVSALVSGVYFAVVTLEDGLAVSLPFVVHEK